MNIVDIAIKIQNKSCAFLSFVVSNFSKILDSEHTNIKYFMYLGWRLNENVLVTLILKS